MQEFLADRPQCHDVFRRSESADRTTRFGHLGLVKRHVELWGT
jgi:hypothetical protein